MIEPGEIEEIAAGGGVGELLGHFFDSEGRLARRPPFRPARSSVSLAAAKPGRVVAIAGGGEKVPAIGAILRSERLSGSSPTN